MLAAAVDIQFHKDYITSGMSDEAKTYLDTFVFAAPVILLAWSECQQHYKDPNPEANSTIYMVKFLSQLEMWVGPP